MNARPAPCPCGTGRMLSQCCGPVLDGTENAVTAEQLMRSRYTAYATGDAGYVFRTWHPSTRPAEVVLDDDLRWTRLEVLGVEGGQPGDDQGVVEFVAHSSRAGGRDRLHEISSFARRAGRWLYLDGTSSG